MDIKRIGSAPFDVPIDVVCSQMDGIFTTTIVHRVGPDERLHRLFTEHNFPPNLNHSSITHWIDWEGENEIDDKMTLREKSLYHAGLVKGMEIGIQGAVGARKTQREE